MFLMERVIAEMDATETDVKCANLVRNISNQAFYSMTNIINVHNEKDILLLLVKITSTCTIR